MGLCSSELEWCFKIKAWECFMTILDGWKTISNERGYMNATTGQNVSITKNQFGEHYSVLLAPRLENDGEERKVSPELATGSKAEAFAVGWMNKRPRGA